MTQWFLRLVWKNMAVITRWSYKRGGRKTGFHCNWIRLNLLLLVSENRKHLRSSDIKWFQSGNSVSIIRDRLYQPLTYCPTISDLSPLNRELRRNILKRKYKNMSSSKGLRCRSEKFKLEICFDGSFDPRDPYGCWGKKRSWAMFRAIKWTSTGV